MDDIGKRWDGETMGRVKCGGREGKVGRRERKLSVQ